MICACEKKQFVPRLKAGGITERFRKRVILQNRSAYITLFIGILFANILLLFGLIMPPVLDNFKTEVLETKLAGYQYILKTPTLTENESAEPFCLASLEYGDNEEISVYGIKADSKYAGFSYLPASSENILVSEGFLEKYGLSVGDKITLHEKYGDKEYSFNVFGAPPTTPPGLPFSWTKRALTRPLTSICAFLTAIFQTKGSQTSTPRPCPPS